MQSIWEGSLPRKRFAPLAGDKTTDVLIIGGGMAGLLCAHRLKQAGVDCLLLEASEIARGVTGNTTAKITVGHALIYDTLSRRFGEECAALYLKAQHRALSEYARLAKGIDCEFVRAPSYVYSLDSREKIEREVAALCRLGYPAAFSSARELPFPVAGAVRVPDQAQFHPLKFAFAIARDLPICEHTKVEELLPHEAVTARGTVRFRRLVIATHFPLDNKHGAFFLKLYQHRSYVLALRGAPAIRGMYVDESEGGISLRAAGDLLLLGGGAHRTGKQGGGWKELSDFAKEHYPESETVARWATQDCMSLDGMPYIGRYHRSAPQMFVATGFNKWGMTNAMVAAGLLTDLILEKPNPCAALFSPARSVLHPQLAVNLFESVVGLLTPTVPRCPHLGCALKYNRAEHSWDCPCHGSRFTEAGELIENPATADHPKKPLL